MPARKSRKAKTSLLIGGLFAAAAAASSAWADTIVLSNGDRLSGEVQLMDGGKLVLKTEYAGEIRINWDQVAQLETADPMLLRGKNLPAGYEARLAAAAQPGAAAALPVNGATAPQNDVALADITRIVRPRPFLREWVFQGGADVAMDATHASSSNQNWNAALRLTARRDMWRHGLNLDYQRKTQDSVVGTHNYNASYTADRFLTEKLFLQGRLRYGRDFIDNPARQTIVGFGPGYQFWDNELGAFSVSALLTHTRYRYQDETQDRFQSAGLSWNFLRYIYGKQWQIFSTGEAYRALRSSGDYSLDAELGLRYSITQWMSLYAKTSYNRVSTEGQPSTNEKRYSVGLGVAW